MIRRDTDPQQCDTGASDLVRQRLLQALALDLEARQGIDAVDMIPGDALKQGIGVGNGPRWPR